MSSRSRHKDLGISAYQPQRTKAHSKFIYHLGDDAMLGNDGLSGNKHNPQHTKPQFKKRRKKNGDVKIIRIR